MNEPSKTIQHTTPSGRLAVVLETGRKQQAPGQFFAVMEGREPDMIDLPDRYLIQDAPGYGYGQTYAAPEFETLEEAADHADSLEAKGDHLAAIASSIGKGGQEE